MRDFGHDVDVLARHRLLDEHGLKWLERFDQQLGRLRADGPVEIDADVDLVASGLAELGEVPGSLIDECLGLHDAGGPAAVDSCLERAKALLHIPPQPIG